MSVGTINAPGGKVVAVENNYGRIIVGDSYPKLIVRAAITGLVAGLVLLLGRWGVPAVIAWFGLVFAWLFKKKREPQEVARAGGGAAARVVVGIAAATALTAAPPLVKNELMAKTGGGGGGPVVIDAGVIDAPPVVIDAVPVDLSHVALVVERENEVADGCLAVLTRARPTGGKVCSVPGARELYAGIDDVVMTASPPIVGARPTLRVLVDGKPVVVAAQVVGSTMRFRIPGVVSDDVRIGIAVGDQAIEADTVFRTVAYPKPFAAWIEECVEKEGAQRELRRSRPVCALPAGRAPVHLRVRTADPNVSGAELGQRVGNDPEAVNPIGADARSDVSVPGAAGRWTLRVTLIDAARDTQVINVLLQ